MKRINRESYTKRILDLLGKNEVIVLTGHRRAGKSCILECLKDLLHDSGNMMYLDMEDPDNASITTFEHLNSWIKEHISNDKRNYILIGEIQEIKEFEKKYKDDEKLIRLHHKITEGRKVYGRLTNQIKINVLKDKFVAGFDYEQFLFHHSSEGKTDNKIIEELCIECEKIFSPPGMKQRYNLLNFMIQ